ncbi:MAG: NAD-dependent deacetylase [Acidobacteriota bacterium]|jgi:NAD-dependent deacetylase|nr:NAD-dependent deacetylase [Acidobacteriota bacterium]
MIAPTLIDAIEEVRTRLRAARSVFVLTGAGVSAESGVPTFRGGGGAAVWKGMPFYEISSAGMVERDLPEVWAWFDYRRGVLQTLQPNPAHATLARWQDEFASFTLATQNVDGLHRAAGSREVLELHGSVWTARCLNCHARADVRELDPVDRPPACLDCGAPMRPDVVLFGEMLPAHVFQIAAMRAASAEVCLVVGTSALVYPAAGLPEVAKRAGALLIEINPETTPLTELCDISLQGLAGEILPRLCD